MASVATTELLRTQASLSLYLHQQHQVHHQFHQSHLHRVTVFDIPSDGKFVYKNFTIN
jgi:hypothetical protein